MTRADLCLKGSSVMRRLCRYPGPCASVSGLQGAMYQFKTKGKLLVLH
jgi:hypothetical protein